MTPGVVWIVGAGQCVAWGVLYYAFGVLVVPVERDLGVARWVVTGAFSAALLVSAIAAPTIGAWTDRGRGPALMQAGGLTASALLVMWAAFPDVWTTYAVWSGLGLAMATALYEPVFAIVGRAIHDGRERLMAIASITVLGGLASSVFLPLTAILIERVGWRGTVYALAIVLAVSTFVVHHTAFRSLAPRFTATVSRTASWPASGEAGHVGGLARLIVTFGASSFASAALATNLIPALIERSVSPTSAATLAGLFGVMQLPGRLLIMNGRLSLGPASMVWTSLGLQVAGLAALVPSTSFSLIAIGVTLFACGSGLATLARPYLVLVQFGADQAGRVNGVIARAQQVARAGGPVGAAALAAAIGYGWVFVLLAALLIAVGIGRPLGADGRR